MQLAEVGALRAAELLDAGPLARLQTHVWREAYRGILPQRLLDGLSVPEARRRWRGYLTAGIPTLVLEGGDDLLGFAGFGPERGAAEAVPAGEVYALYLHPRVWGRGHGRTLFEACREGLRARGYRPLVLWVLRENQRARAFYRRQGLAPDGAETVERLAGFPLRQVRYRAVERAPGRERGAGPSRPGSRPAPDAGPCPPGPPQGLRASGGKSVRGGGFERI